MTPKTFYILHFYNDYIETCTMKEERKENDHSCLVIDGRLSIYLSELDAYDSYKLQLSSSIQSMMDNGLLNDCHPAIVNVTYLDISSDVQSFITEPEDKDGNDNNEPIVLEISNTTSSWIALGGTIMSLCVFLIALTRYRYFMSVREELTQERELNGRRRHHQQDIVNVDDNSSSGAFVDISEIGLYQIEEQRRGNQEEEFGSQL